MTQADDWADKLSQDIIAEFDKYGREPGFPFMLAMRLRMELNEQNKPKHVPLGVISSAVVVVGLGFAFVAIWLHLAAHVARIAS